MLRAAQKIKEENQKFYYGNAYANWISKGSFLAYQIISIVVFAAIMLVLKWKIQESQFYQQAFTTSTNGREVKDWVFTQMSENYFDLSTWLVMISAIVLIVYLSAVVSHIPSYEIYKRSVLIHIGPLGFAGVGIAAIFLSGIHTGEVRSYAAELFLYGFNELALVMTGKLLSTLGAREMKDSEWWWRVIDSLVDRIIQKL